MTPLLLLTILLGPAAAARPGGADERDDAHLDRLIEEACPSSRHGRMERDLEARGLVRAPMARADARDECAVARASLTRDAADRAERLDAIRAEVQSLGGDPDDPDALPDLTRASKRVRELAAAAREELRLLTRISSELAALDKRAHDGGCRSPAGRPAAPRARPERGSGHKP